MSRNQFTSVNHAVNTDKSWTENDTDDPSESSRVRCENSLAAAVSKRIDYVAIYLDVVVDCLLD
jgi:hypothetical protein